MILIQTPSVTIFYRAVGGERYARIHSACTWHWQNCLVAGRRRSSFYSQNQVLIGQSSNLCPNVVQSWATEGWELSFQSLQEMICGIRSPTGTETQLDTCEFTHTHPEGTDTGWWRIDHIMRSQYDFSVWYNWFSGKPLGAFGVSGLCGQLQQDDNSHVPPSCLDVLICPDPCMVQSESSVRSLCGLGQSIAGII